MDTDKKALALITARGGSKRVPRKNVRPLAGLPMVAWPVRAAVESGLFERVIISTEDPEIAEIAVAHGAECPFMRPAELADDYSTSADVVAHALNFLHHQDRPVPPEVCVLYGTSCFVSPALLRQGQELLRQPGTDRVFAACAYPHPIERAFSLDKEGLARRLHSQYARTRTQDLPKSYYDLGLCYWQWSKPRSLPAGMEEVRRALVLPHNMAVDIDTEEDFALAQLFAQHLGMEKASWRGQ